MLAVIFHVTIYPGWFSHHCHRRDAAVVEDGVHMLAVGHGRRRGVRILPFLEELSTKFDVPKGGLIDLRSRRRVFLDTASLAASSAIAVWLLPRLFSDLLTTNLTENLDRPNDIVRAAPFFRQADSGGDPCPLGPRNPGQFSPKEGVVTQNTREMARNRCGIVSLRGIMARTFGETLAHSWCLLIKAVARRRACAGTEQAALPTNPEGPPD